MSFNLSQHEVTKIEAKSFSRNGTHWVEIVTTDRSGHTAELTLFCERELFASLLADSISQVETLENLTYEYGDADAA